MSFINDFCTFLNETPTPMHFVQKAREELTKGGFTELKETELWPTIPNKFFVVRDERCIAAFNKHDLSAGLLVVTHIDSPCFRNKPHTYLSRCGVEQMRISPYGGGSWNTWLDRDLKVAGRVLYKEKETGNPKFKLFESSEAVAVIPTLAIHLNRDLSTLANLNLEDDIMPILSLYNNESKPKNHQSPPLLATIAASAEIDENDIIDYDVYLVDAQGPVVLGTDHDLLSAPRLDDLSCAITGLRGFLAAKDPENGLNAFVAFDAEEIGNNLRTGANSNFLSNIFERLKIPGSFSANSLLISADNAHANHPNFPSKNDSRHPVSLGDGVVTLSRANYSFATDLASLNQLRNLNKKELKPSVTRNDMPAGQTLGPKVSAKFGIPAVDLGIPMLGMHSIHETCAVKDLETLQYYFTDIINEFNNSTEEEQ